MTTYNVGGSYAAQGGQPRIYAQFAYIDFTARASVAADVWNVFHIPRYTIVKAIKWFRATSAGAACTVDVADVTLGTTYEASLDLNGTGDVAIDDATLPIYYTAASDIIKLTMGHANSTGKGYFYIICQDIRPFIGV